RLWPLELPHADALDHSGGDFGSIGQPPHLRDEGKAHCRVGTGGGGDEDSPRGGGDLGAPRKEEREVPRVRLSVAADRRLRGCLESAGRDPFYLLGWVPAFRSGSALSLHPFLPRLRTGGVPQLRAHQHPPKERESDARPLLSRLGQRRGSGEGDQGGQGRALPGGKGGPGGVRGWLSPEGTSPGLRRQAGGRVKRFSEELRQVPQRERRRRTEGIELNYPVSVTEYFKREWLKQW